MAKQSVKGRLNRADIERIVRNALIFLAPVILVSLETLQRGGTFEEVLVAVKVWVLGVVLDTFRKLQAGK